MTKRFHTKKEEMTLLAQAYKHDPGLFEQKEIVEDPSVLEAFGIHIPHKEDFPTGTLKLWPEDFIVEEVSIGGEVSAVAPPTSVPSHIGDSPTVYTTLVKCGLSTIDAVADLSRILDAPKDTIAYAGIKDKDALTAQRISLRKVSPDALHNANSPYFFLNDIAGGKGAVGKGELRGNRFTILIRTDVSLVEDKRVGGHVAQALEKVTNEGFYNFFYLQRFGTPRLCNYEWASLILRGEYEKAVLSILSLQGDRELPYFKQIRQQMKYSFGKWEEIQRLIGPFPLMFAHENKIVNHLAANPNDYLGALKTIAEQITLWMYALASLFFNEKISSYLRHGKEPPAHLPFFLSPDRRDQDVYKDLLQQAGLYPLPLQNLRLFPQIQVRSRMTPTRDKVTILKGEIIPEGLVLEFELAKGQYATTFLSHLFNLTAGKLPSDISKKRIDTKELLGEESIQPVLEKFKDVIKPKGENEFENLLKEE